MIAPVTINRPHIKLHFFAFLFRREGSGSSQCGHWFALIDTSLLHAGQTISAIFRSLPWVVHGLNHLVRKRRWYRNRQLGSLRLSIVDSSRSCVLQNPRSGQWSWTFEEVWGCLESIFSGYECLSSMPRHEGSSVAGNCWWRRPAFTESKNSAGGNRPAEIRWEYSSR